MQILLQFRVKDKKQQQDDSIASSVFLFVFFFSPSTEINVDQLKKNRFPSYTELR